MNSCSVEMLAPPTLTCETGTGMGKESACVDTHRNTAFWMTMETPMAEMSGARREMWRSGRYAKRSTSTLMSPAPAIATANMATAARGPLPKRPGSAKDRPSAMKDPSMSTSLCAKLIMVRMP
jgi:hypothetical protein